MSLDHRLARVVKRHAELGAQMASEGRKEAQEIARLSREYAELSPTVERIVALQRAKQEQADLDQLIEDTGGDAEMRAMAEEELKALKQRIPILEQEVKLALLPKDEADERN